LTSTRFVMPDMNGTDQSVTVKATKEVTSIGDPGVKENGAGFDSLATSIIEQPDMNYIQVRRGRTSQLHRCYS
jgi:hypothetical protein